MDVHLRNGSFYDAREIDVEPSVRIWRKAGLHANLSGTQIYCFFDPANDLIVRKKVSLFVPVRTAERAKTAVLDAHVGKVDIAVDDIGNDVAYLLASKFIGRKHHD